MTEKNTHGGARINSGRKPVPDKTITVPIYPKQSRLDALGIDAIQSISIKAVEREFKKVKK